MYGRRVTGEFLKNVEDFIQFAEENRGNNGDAKIRCPCKDCGNFRRLEVDEVKSHIVRRGFTSGYQNWIWHGEAVIRESVPAGTSRSIQSGEVGTSRTIELETETEGYIDLENVIENESGAGGI